MWASRQAGWDIEGFFFDGNWLMFAAGILVYYTTNYGGRAHQQGAAAFLLLAAIVSRRESLPSLTSVPKSACMTLLVMDQPHNRLSGEKPGA